MVKSSHTVHHCTTFQIRPFACKQPSKQAHDTMDKKNKQSMGNAANPKPETLYPKQAQHGGRSMPSADGTIFKTCRKESQSASCPARAASRPCGGCVEVMVTLSNRSPVVWVEIQHRRRVPSRVSMQNPDTAMWDRFLIRARPHAGWRALGLRVIVR